MAEPAESTEEDHATPKREKTEPEESGSASRYPTRMFSYSVVVRRDEDMTDARS